jgi:phenylalanine-4-hydroxylase
MKPRRPFHVFTEDDNITWRMLFERQLPQVQQYATGMYLEGLDKLGMTAERIPDFAELNERFKALVGWELVSTDVQYSSGQEWFEALARKEFLITEYIRDRKDLEYTPLPDIWHDTFGHLPFMANPWYADYIHQFAHYAIRYTPEQRKSLGSLWWYTVEFGLIWEDGRLKALGAGLMSSYAELKRVYTGDVRLVPYTLEAFENLAPSPHEFHEQLFILDSWEHFERTVIEWAEAHAHIAPHSVQEKSTSGMPGSAL